MRVYLEFAKKAFSNNMVYRMDFYAGVLNAIVMIFVNVSIWRAIYEADDSLGDIQFKMLVTYVVLSFLLQIVYMMDDYFIESKVRSGLIATDLLKPMNFRLYVFSYNFGITAFKLAMQVLPACCIALLLFRFLPPFSLTYFLFFVLSCVLGYFVIYNLNFIFWVSSFWFYSTFSLITIKDAVVMIMSGALIPVWFMPQPMIDLIAYTPFEALFSIPIRIYLGMVPQEQIIHVLLKQGVWIAVLFVAGKCMWAMASKKVVVQGG